MQKARKYIILVIIAVIIGIGSKVFAFEMIPNLENIDLESRKITVLLNISDLAEYSNGINVASGRLVYDQDVFENISFNATNGWTCAYNDNSTTEGFGKFMLVTTSGNVKKEQEVAQINLKVKDGVGNIRTKIKLESLETTYNLETIKAEDKEIKIDITKDKIKLSDEKNTKTGINVEKTEKTNYNMYIIIICIIIILILFLTLLIKFKRKGGKKNV